MFTQNTQFTYIELFAGIGGFRIAMEALGDSELVWGCDIDRPARCTYRCNFGQDQVLYTDITEAKTSFIPTHDILTAGFPCQDFSTLGAGTEGGQQGLEGDTGSLFFQVVRVLRDVQPKSFLLENVHGLLTLNNGETIKKVIQELESVGYTVQYKSINSLCLVPQFRRRIYLVGFLDPVVAERFAFPKEPKLSPSRTVGDILCLNDPFLEIQKLSRRQWHAVGQDKSTKKYGKDKRLLRPSSKEADTLLKSYRASRKTMSQFVYTENQIDGCPRWLTTRECARLMGFPNSHQFPSGPKAYNQLGNAVTPPLIAMLGGSVLAALKNDQSYIRIGLEQGLALALDATAPTRKHILLNSFVTHPDFEHCTVETFIYGRQRRKIELVVVVGLMCCNFLFQ